MFADKDKDRKRTGRASRVTNAPNNAAAREHNVLRAKVYCSIKSHRTVFCKNRQVSLILFRSHLSLLLTMVFKVAGKYHLLATLMIDLTNPIDISLAAFGRKEIEIAEVCIVNKLKALIRRRSSIYYFAPE